LVVSTPLSLQDVNINRETKTKQKELKFCLNIFCAHNYNEIPKKSSLG